jgi:hypothetical protein
MAAPFTSQFTINHVVPAVVSTTLTGAFNSPVNHDRIVFNTAIDPSSFTFGQYSLRDPGGNAVNVTGITPADGTNTQFDITFDQQSAPGPYNLTVGPNITNLLGDAMAGPFTSQFTITGSNNLIINGGFETGDFTGWNQTGDTSQNTVDTSHPHSGTYAARLGPVGDEGFLDQAFSSTPGASYTLSYWLLNYGGPTNEFEAYIDRNILPGSQVVNSSAFPYTQYTFPFIATGTTTDVMFGFRQDPSFWFLGDVMVAAAGPAPHGGLWDHAALDGVIPAPASAFANAGLSPSPAAPLAVQAVSPEQQRALGVYLTLKSAAGFLSISQLTQTTPVQPSGQNGWPVGQTVKVIRKHVPALDLIGPPTGQPTGQVAGRSTDGIDKGLNWTEH